MKGANEAATSFPSPSPFPRPLVLSYTVLSSPLLALIKLALGFVARRVASRRAYVAPHRLPRHATLEATRLDSSVLSSMDARYAYALSYSPLLTLCLLSPLLHLHSVVSTR